MHTGDVSTGVHRPAGMHMRANSRAARTCRRRSGRRRRCSSTTRSISARRSTASSRWSPTPARPSGVYDSKSALEALTQPDLKNRGVAYWQAAAPVAGAAVPEARLHRHDGRDICTRSMPTPAAPCADFGVGGVVDVNQWNIENAKWPLSLLQPPTVYEDTLFLGWAGKDWADARSTRRARSSRSMRAPARSSWELPDARRRRPRRRAAPATSGPRCRSIPSATCSTSRSVRPSPTSTAAPGSSRPNSSPR